MGQSVFLAVPHNGTLSPEAIPGLSQPTLRGSLRYGISKASVLTRNFNELWCDALNMRGRAKLTHFAMHHSDIEAPQGWLDTLIDEAERVGADIISAVVPIKDERGLTSTAVMDEADAIQRLTLAEVRKLPPTFSAATFLQPGLRLLVNTGLWVCRFDPGATWVEEVEFTNIDGIIRGDDGVFRTTSLSEDWAFSRWASERGLKVFATRVVPVTHYGVHGFSTEGPAGTWPTDQGEPQKQLPG